MTQVDPATSCPGCHRPWAALGALHLCVPRPECPAVETRTIRMRCRCGRDIYYAATSHLPKCTGCSQVCHVCTCSEVPQANVEAPTDAAVVPGGSPRLCVVCAAPAGVYFATSPICPAHASPDALSRALREARAEVAALRQEHNDYAVSIGAALREARANTETLRAAITRALAGCPFCKMGQCRADAHGWLADALEGAS